MIYFSATRFMLDPPDGFLSRLNARAQRLAWSASGVPSLANRGSAAIGRPHRGLFRRGVDPSTIVEVYDTGKKPFSSLIIHPIPFQSPLFQLFTQAFILVRRKKLFGIPFAFNRVMFDMFMAHADGRPKHLMSVGYLIQAQEMARQLSSLIPGEYFGYFERSERWGRPFLDDREPNSRHAQ